MSQSAWLAFVLTSAALICTPGPGTALTVDTALRRGRRAALTVAAGVVIGQAIWVLLAACGVTTALADSPTIGTALQAAGGGYLVVLGVRRFASAGRAAPAPSAADRRAALRAGIATNLTNPKMLAVAASLLPGAALGRGDPAAWTLLLGGIFCTITIAWLTLCTVATALARERLLSPSGMRISGRLTGAALVLLGARLLVDAVNAELMRP